MRVLPVVVVAAALVAIDLTTAHCHAQAFTFLLLLAFDLTLRAHGHDLARAWQRKGTGSTKPGKPHLLSAGTTLQHLHDTGAMIPPYYRITCKTTHNTPLRANFQAAFLENGGSANADQ